MTSATRASGPALALVVAAGIVAVVVFVMPRAEQSRAQEPLGGALREGRSR